MDLRLAIGCTLAVIAIGIAIYEACTPRKPSALPPPAPDERDSIQNFKRMHQP